ncbi:MAG: zinc ribbon domain-containing protein [Proteobacteria bacterium]|nr:zinc ribbon domain-containing protein [Pseudomonadota bacterium]
MPNYDYLCKKCKKLFTMVLTLSEYENGKIKCPHCGSERLKQQITTFMTKTSRKS